MKTRLFGLAALSLASSACGSAPPATATGNPNPASPVESVEAPLSFEANGGKKLPVPMVEVRIAGKPTRLIVDSGASDHVLTRAFAKSTDIAIGKDVITGQDHGDKTIEASRFAPTRVKLPSNEVGFEGFVIDGPPPFEPLGIGGFFSPQRLEGQGYVVLDFPRGRLVALRNAREPDVIEWLRRQLGANPERLATKWSGNKPFVEAAVGARKAVLAELDSGGSGSEATAGYLGIGLGQVGCDGIGVSGACVEGGKADGQSVRFAGQTFDAVSLSVREAIKNSRGAFEEHMLVGMDVLRACTVAIPQDRQSAILAHCTHH